MLTNVSCYVSGKVASNRLLDRLSPASRRLLAPIKATDLGQGASLFEHCADGVFFPIGNAVASIVSEFDDGRAVETLLVGSEGALGVVNHDFSSRAIVQCAGTFLVASRGNLNAVRRASPEVDELILRYKDCLIAEVLQTAACNAAHSLEQRAARRLVALLERSNQNAASLTQEQLGDLLGFGRSYINRLLKVWQEQGLVEWSRRAIAVKDFDGLGKRSCRCRDAVRTHYDLVLPGLHPASALNAV